MQAKVIGFGYFYNSFSPNTAEFSINCRIFSMKAGIYCRHCERSEAIHVFFWIASAASFLAALAMTMHQI